MLDLDYRSIRFSERMEGGFIGFQPDRDGVQPGGRSYEAMFPFGDFGRPLDPAVDPERQGVGCNGLVAHLGDREAWVMPCTEPRVQELLPDPGKGGRGTHGCIDFGGGRLAVPYQVFYGAGVDGITPGTFHLVVPRADGKNYLVEIDVANDRIRITHPDGPLLEVGPEKVALGATGGKPVMLAVAGWASFFADVQAVAAAVGKTVTVPAGYEATKVNAT